MQFQNGENLFDGQNRQTSFFWSLKANKYEFQMCSDYEITSINYSEGETGRTADELCSVYVNGH